MVLGEGNEDIEEEEDESCVGPFSGISYVTQVHVSTETDVQITSQYVGSAIFLVWMSVKRYSCKCI